MTQTLRRELRQKFEDILQGFSDKLTIAERESTAELLADAALEVRGIAKIDLENSDPAWSLLTGKAITQKQLDKQAEIKIFEDMLKSEFQRLRLNWIAFDDKAKDNFRRFIRDLPEGQSLSAFINWWMSDEYRASNPPWTLAVVMQRFPQAFTHKTGAKRGEYTTDSTGAPETY